MIKKFIPITRRELPRFLCIATMMIAVAYMLNVLRVTKDALIISQLGVEFISAIKLWLVLPFSFLFMLLYIKLADKLTRTQLFHSIIWFLISYFVLFALVIYPHKEILSINISAITLAKFPNLKYFFHMISNWHYCLFFVFSEMVVTAVYSISFWQIANHLTTIEESKRFYPLLGFVSQLGLMLSGILSKLFASSSANWQLTLNKTVTSLVVSGVFLSLSFVILGKVVGIEVLNRKSSPGVITKSPKNKIGLKDSLKYILSSKPILLITLLLLCYNISLNISEGVWKKSVEIFFANDANKLQYFLGNVSLYRSILSMVFSLLGVYLMQFFKWKTLALAIPITILTIGGLFFLFLLFNANPNITTMTMGISTLAIAVYFGAIHNTITKSSKHSLFDSTKEMMYISLDDELKTKGKAAAETVGLRFGKGFGSFIQQLLLMLFPALTLLDLAPVISIIFIITVLCWIFSITGFKYQLETNSGPVSIQK